MGVLNAYDEELLRVITTTLYGNRHLLQREDLATLSSILVSLMKLQYKYLELIDSVVDIFMSGPEDAKMSDEQMVENLPVDLLSSVITVCASLNHVPEKWTLGIWLDTVVKKIQESPTVGPKIWLNTVYSLVVLGKANAAAISSVLSNPGIVVTYFRSERFNIKIKKSIYFLVTHVILLYFFRTVHVDQMLIVTS